VLVERAAHIVAQRRNGCHGFAMHKRVGVVIEAEHTCMTVRGVRARGSVTVTSALLGPVRDDPRSRQEFFALARVGATTGG
jgi:GTP cyclohydrolase I